MSRARGRHGVPGRPDRHGPGQARRRPAASWPQFEQALGNLLTALAAAGGQPEDLVSLTIYLIDVEDYQAHGKEIGAVWRRLAGTEYPAMAGVGVTRLWDPAALVEIQGIAAVTPR